MVGGRPGLTVTEIAALYGRSAATVGERWTAHPDWPAPIGHRGRAREYDPDDVERVVRVHFLHPIPDVDPARLYTAQEAAEVTGLSARTIRADASRGHWPAPDRVDGGSPMWLGATVREAVRLRARKR